MVMEVDENVQSEIPDPDPEQSMVIHEGSDPQGASRYYIAAISSQIGLTSITASIAIG